MSLTLDATAPADEAGIAAVVADASAAGEPLLVCGNGTKLGMLRPVQAARSLSARNLTGITLHAPKELVISARAGTTLAELEAAVASGGQHIIAEPPDLTALLGAATGTPQTLGGVVAANLSGPRRVAWGAMRDHVMGVRAVNGAGETIHSGGRVLKNVTGLDLCKLLTGSHGTLAVLTEITLKVLPAPETTGSVAIAGLDAVAGVAALSAALGSPYGVSAAAWLPAEAAALVPALAVLGGSVAVVRIEDFATSVAYRLDRLRAELGGEAVLLADPDSRAVWRAVRDAVPLANAPEDAVWRVSVRPSAGPGVLAALRPLGVRGFLDWGGGLVWLAGPCEAATHQAVTRAALGAGGTWTLLRARDPLRAAVAVVPPEPAPLAAITRRVKAAFDPRGVLNPGRLYAGL
jgi:glycolate oxidase FAD binding subunit